MNGTQVRNLFYVKRTSAGQGEPTLGTVPGDLIVKAMPASLKTSPTLEGKKFVQLQYVNPDGKLITSDFIVSGQADVKAVTGKKTLLKKAVLELKEAPVAGEDYIVDILVHNYQTIAENSVLAKYGAAYASSGMTKGQLLLALGKSFAGNFRRDAHLNDFFKFWLAVDAADATTYKEVKFDSKASDFAAGSGASAVDIDDYLYLVIEEKEQPTWYRGTYPKQTVRFDVAPHTILSNGDETQPFVTNGDTGLVAIVPIDSTGSTAYIPNGYAMADLEYQCHGEIGDQIREAGGIRSIKTKYAISDADVTSMFDTVEIYFHYEGRNTAVQKSEKQLTLAVKQSNAQGAPQASAIATAISNAL